MPRRLLRNRRDNRQVEKNWKCIEDTLLANNISDVERVVKTLDRYLTTLIDWNQSYNLTSVRQPQAVIERHFSDSLSVLPFIDTDENVLDVGTGAGFPGVVLAIACPNMRVCVIDSQIKKVTFLRQLIMELELPNVLVIHKKVEEFNVNQSFNQIVSRAFSSIEGIVTNTAHLLNHENENAKVISMKGVFPMAELQDLNIAYDSHSVHVPGLSESRHIIIAYPGQEANDENQIVYADEEAEAML